MKFDIPLIMSLLVGYANNIVVAKNNDCKLLQGPFEKTCVDISIEYCSDSTTAMPCKFSADCWTNAGIKKHHEFMLPTDVTYLNVVNNDGDLLHPTLANLLQMQNTSTHKECNTCILPVGNYDESCYDIAISYVRMYEDVNTPCLFRASCDVHMRHRTSVNHLSHKGGPRKHNEALLPKNVLFSDVKNLEGRLIHPSQQLNVVTDLCHESGSTVPVAMQSGAIAEFGSGLLPKVTLATTMLLTLY